MVDRIRNLVAYARRFGWHDTAHVCALWVGRRLFGYRAAVVYRLDLTAIPPLGECLELECDYVPLEGVSHAFTASLPSEGARTRLQARFFVGMLGGEQCYCSVVSTVGFAVPDRVAISFNSNTDAYVGDCITLPAFRGKSIYPCALTTLGRHLRAEGKQALYLFIERDNLASIRSVRKAGFVPFAIASTWRLGRLCRRRWRAVDSLAAGGTSPWTVRPLVRAVGPGEPEQAPR